MNMLDTRSLRNALSNLTSRLRLRRVDRIGLGATVFGVPSIANDGRIELGEAVSLCSIPVASHFAAAPGSLIRIGDGVRIAHGVGIYTSSEVLIGRDTTIGAMVLILDIELHGEMGSQRRGVPRIHIGRNVHLGSGVIVLRGASIGDGLRVAPNQTIAGELS